MYRWPRPLRLAKERDCKKKFESPPPGQVEAPVSFTCGWMSAFFLHLRENPIPSLLMPWPSGPACSTTKGSMVWGRAVPCLRFFSAAAAMAEARGMWEVAGTRACVGTWHRPSCARGNYNAGAGPGPGSRARAHAACREVSSGSPRVPARVRRVRVGSLCRACHYIGDEAMPWCDHSCMLKSLSQGWDERLLSRAPVCSISLEFSHLIRSPTVGAMPTVKVNELPCVLSHPISPL